MRYKITIDRWAGVEEASRENWKDLISSLALCGFEVYADEEKIVFKTGDGEIVEQIKEDK
jgi:hypothetical protein